MKCWYLILEHTGNIKTDTVSNDLSISSNVICHNPCVWCHFVCQWNTKGERHFVVSIHRASMDNRPT